MQPPYLVNTIHGGERVAVLAYRHGADDICFLDVGWHEGGKPFHIIQGPFKPNEDGSILANDGGESIQVLPEDHPLWYNWQNWLDFLDSPDATDVDPEDAVQGCAANGALIDQPI